MVRGDGAFPGLMSAVADAARSGATDRGAAIGRLYANARTSGADLVDGLWAVAVGLVLSSYRIASVEVCPAGLTDASRAPRLPTAAVLLLSKAIDGRAGGPVDVTLSIRTVGRRPTLVATWRATSGRTSGEEAVTLLPNEEGAPAARFPGDGRGMGRAS